MKFSQLRNQSGQMTIEMILISFILLGIALSLSNTAKSNGYVASLVEGPWKTLQGMIEDGVWKEAGDDSRLLHPAHLSRHGSAIGEAP